MQFLHCFLFFAVANSIYGQLETMEMDDHIFKYMVNPYLLTTPIDYLVIKTKDFVVIVSQMHRMTS